MRRRILRAILLAVLVTGFALGIPLGYSALQVVEDVTRKELSTRARQIATILDEQLARGTKIDLNEVQLVPPGGELLVRMPGEADRRLGPDLGETDTLTERQPIVRQGEVYLTIPDANLRRDQLEMAGLVMLLVVVSMGIGTAVATVTARRLADPLRHVANRAARLGAGDFRPDRRRYEVPELDRLAEALDTSATALAELMQRERELIGDVSHQLRSRLTAMRLRLEGLAMHPEEATASEAAAALEQVDHLVTVLEELLAAAHRARSVGAEPVDLAVELPAIAAEWREPLRKDGRALRIRVTSGLLARATPSRLREAVGVLLDNASRHGDGTVTISARHGDGMVTVEISDGGAGVPDELVAHVFERGVSGSGSTGVGLALARALVEADGGRLELSSTRRATFVIFLPVPRADDLVGLPWPAETPR
ncbi:ATP-binding protein [Allokutzneria albata]|uniref:Signal transduction histidine-protein kinase/phosphatase MprB n=1 Tax=Allokutzneria albata TaxID=211114 RepID=A0A1H0BCC8_ALLAB|nr:ATP-binding protein [Allokutzneria albata]SDN43278.1 Signal transduction histidine kinase [Allokutzneria albata]